MKSYLRTTVFSLLIVLCLNQKGFGQCITYATVPYTQNFESTWINPCGGAVIPDPSWVNNSPTSQTSGSSGWNRDDYSAWGGISKDWYTPPASVGNYSARFHSTLINGGSNNFDLYLDCSPDTEEDLSFYYVNGAGADYMDVYLSTDSGTTFTILGHYTTTFYQGWTLENLVFKSNSPKTIIRFEGTAVPKKDGGDDIGLDYVQVLLPCKGKPVTNLIITGSCSNALYSIEPSISLEATGLSYAWQQSANNISWSTIADTLSFIKPSPSILTYYRAIVTCINSGLIDTTSGAKIGRFYNNIPYKQNFDSWIDRCDTLDVPDTGWTNNPPGGNDSWRRNDQGDSAGWTTPNSGAYYPASPTGGHSARFHSAGSTFGSTDSLDLYVNCSTGTNSKELSFYYINEDGVDSMFVLLSTDNGITFNTIAGYGTTPIGWAHDSLVFTSYSSTTVIGFLAIADDGGSDIGLDNVQVQTTPLCADKPVAGYIVKTSLSCSRPGDSLMLSGNSSAYGIVYNWQQSSDSINWNTITGDTSTSVFVAPATLTYYRAIVNCPTSGLSDTTAKIKIGSIISSFFRQIPYTQDFESWINNCSNLDVPDTGWINNPPVGDGSWRRDDQGDYGEWQGFNEFCDCAYTPSSAYGNHSARFHTYYYNALLGIQHGATGTLDLYVNCSTITGTKQLSFYYINPNQTISDDSMNVYISTDGGVTFSPLLSIGSTLTWTEYILPIVSNAAETVISFVAKSPHGYDDQVDMGLDFVQVISPCQGKPVAGNIITQSTCYGDSLVLSGSSLASGLSYTWQQSSDSISWITITGDTASVLTVIPFNLNYYRAIVSCNTSGLSDTTAKVKVSGNGSFYRKIPYTQNFESWMNHCDTLDVPDTGWINIPSSGENSWRRDDQFASNLQNGFLPSGISGKYACFNAFASAGSTGELDLYINCSTTTGTKELSFYYNNSNTNNSAFNVYVSTNGGTSFGTSLITCPSTGTTSNYQTIWTHYTVPIISDSAETVISFVATAPDPNNNGYDVGLDVVQVLPACQDKPVAGNIVTQVACPGDSLLLSGSSQAVGLLYAWQQSSNGINWSAITGDTTTAIVVVPYTLTYYRAIVICNNSGLSDTTAKVQVSGNGSFYRNIPYTQNFEAWMNRCAILDVPDTGWVNNPVTGNDSWRRNDEGSSANWNGADGTAYGYITPTPSGSSYSAAFNAYDATQGSKGALNLYVNCNTVIGTKLLSFYYLNPQSKGTDSMNVYVSTDGGNTFGPSLITCRGGTTAWTKSTLPIASDSPRVVISFVGTSADLSSDIFLDYVQVLVQCQGKPVAGKASASPAVVCSSETSTISVVPEATGLKFQWQHSPDSTAWSNLAGDTTASVTTPPVNAGAYYRCIVTCIQSGLSDTSGNVYLIYLSNCLPTYCAPQSTAESGDNIGNVTINYGIDTLLNNGIDSPAIQSGLSSGEGQYYISYVVSGLIVNLIQGYTYTISTAAITDVLGGNYSDTGYIYIDYNHDGIWESTERAWSAPYILPFSNSPQPVSGAFTVPLTADTGYTEMRLQLSYQKEVITPCSNGTNGGGETEDYLVHVAPSPPCSGTPSAGNVEPASDTLCTGSSANFYLVGTSVAAGLTYQWQSSPDNSTWTNIPGAVSSQYSVQGITSSIYYRCQVTCSNSSQSSYSTSAYVYISSLPVNPTAKGDTICGRGNALLTASGTSGHYYWFTSNADSLPVYSGSTYSPYVTKDKTYYVSSATSNSAYCTTGFDSLSVSSSFTYPGCSAFNSNGQLNSVDTGLAGLVFNVQTGITLTGVFIFPQFSGTFYVYLLDSSGVKLDSVLATVTNPQFPNPYWVPLDFGVPVGTGYQLVARISDVNCMANEDNRSSFPFTDCNNSISITGGTADGLSNQTYYFFYKLVINQGCESGKIPASVYVKIPPALSISATNNGYSCNGDAFSGVLTANGNSYTSYTWSPLTGLNSQNGQTNSCTIDTDITYTVTASTGTCNNTAQQTIHIVSTVIISQNISSNYNCAGVPVQINSSASISPPAINYCLPSLPGDCNEYLSAFNFDGISITDNSCPGYVNYTDTAFVQAGKSYTISITPSQNTNSYGFGVWIDYNQNGVFTDTTELVYVIPNQTFSGSQAETATITIPKNARHGYTRMRVISFLNNTPDLYSGDCNLESLEGSNQTNIGTIEDFTIDVTNNDKFLYSWSPAAGLSNTSIPNPIATPSVSTPYSLIVTDSVSQCSATLLTDIYVYPAPDINIYAPQDTLCIGDSEVLDAGIGFVSYLWNTGDTTEQITINSAGNYSVKVTAQNTCTGNDTINIPTQICTGINEIDAGNYSIGVYPNPFDNQFTLELKGLPTGEFIFVITNTLGQKVLEFKDQNAETAYKRTIDLHELPSGMYYISILLNGKNYIKHIIKAN